ncbi:hypothetical protein [Pseudoalteromonas xiamenensis]
MKNENNIQKKRIFTRLVAKTMTSEELMQVAGGNKDSAPSATSYSGTTCEPDDCAVEF